MLYVGRGNASASKGDRGHWMQILLGIFPQRAVCNDKMPVSFPYMVFVLHVRACMHIALVSLIRG